MTLYEATQLAKSLKCLNALKSFPDIGVELILIDSETCTNGVLVYSKGGELDTTIFLMNLCLSIDQLIDYACVLVKNTNEASHYLEDASTKTDLLRNDLCMLFR